MLFSNQLESQKSSMLKLSYGSTYGVTLSKLSLSQSGSIPSSTTPGPKIQILRGAWLTHQGTPRRSLQLTLLSLEAYTCTYKQILI